MTRRGLIALAGVLLIVGCAKQAAHDWPEPEPALWEVSGPDGQKGWLFGTIHALPPGVEWRTPVFESAFREADMLMVEIGNLGDRQDAATAFRQRSDSTGLAPLTQRVVPADRPKVVTLLGKAGMDESDFRSTETWAAALELANATRSGDPENGVDRSLLLSGRPTQALETYAQQFDRFDRLGARAQADLLVAVAEDLSESGADSRVTAWLTGDIDSLGRDLERGFRGNAELRDGLLVERNERFAARMTAFLDTAQGKKTVFLAVGAGHMGGPDGLPALLEAAGYTVRRIQ